jgi:glutathione S-transferase
MVYRCRAADQEELPHLAAWYARLTERPAYARYVMSLA